MFACVTIIAAYLVCYYFDSIRNKTMVMNSITENPYRQLDEKLIITIQN